MTDKTSQYIDQKEVNFYGDKLTAIRLVTGKVYIPIRPICDNLGVILAGQRERINRDPVLSGELNMGKIPSRRMKMVSRVSFRM